MEYCLNISQILHIALTYTTEHTTNIYKCDGCISLLEIGIEISVGIWPLKEFTSFYLIYFDLGLISMATLKSVVNVKCFPFYSCSYINPYMLAQRLSNGVRHRAREIELRLAVVHADCSCCREANDEPVSRCPAPGK